MKIAIPRYAVYMRLITIPFASDREIDSMIAFEAEKYLPFPVADACLAWAPQGDTMPADGSPLSVVLIAIKRDVVDTYLGPHQRGGIFPESLIPQTLVWQQSIRQDARLKNSSLLLVWADETGWETDIFENGNLLVTRGQRFSSDTAESRLKELREEIVKTRRLYDKPIEYILLPPSLRDSYINAGSGETLADYPALVSSDSVQMHGTLIPDEIMSRNRRHNRVRLVSKHAVPVVAVICGLTLLTMVFYHQAIRRTYGNFKYRRVYAAQREQAEHQRRELKKAEVFLSSAILPLHMLTVLQEVVPAGMSVTELQYDAPRNKAMLRVRTLSYESVLAFQARLLGNSAFTAVQNKGSQKSQIDGRDVVDCEFSFQTAPYTVQYATQALRGVNNYWQNSAQKQSLAFQSYVQASARAAGIDEVISLRPQDAYLIWEGRGSLLSLMAFMSTLSSGALPCKINLMRLTPAGEEQQTIKAVFTIEQSWAPGKTLVSVVPIENFSAKPVSRSIFKPLWNPVPSGDDRKSTFSKPASQAKAELEEKALAYAREETLRLQQEEAERQARRNQLEEDLKLTGIVNDGTRVVAFIQNRRDGSRTSTVATGDIIEGCTVTDISEATGRVTLRNEQIILDLNLQ